MVDTGTAYSKTAFASRRSSYTTVFLLEIIWIDKHGVPSSSLSIAKLTRGAMWKWLHSRDTAVKKLLLKEYNETRIVKKKAYCKENSREASAWIFLLRGCCAAIAETFSINLFFESRRLSSFEQVCNYFPSVLCKQSAQITRILLDAHIHQAQSWALNRLLKSCSYRSIALERLQPWFDEFYFIKLQNTTSQINSDLGLLCQHNRFTKPFGPPIISWQSLSTKRFASILIIIRQKIVGCVHRGLHCAFSLAGAERQKARSTSKNRKKFWSFSRHAYSIAELKGFNSTSPTDIFSFSQNAKKLVS